MKTNYTIPIAIVIAGVLVAGALFINGRHSQVSGTGTTNGQTPAADVKTSIAPITSKDHVLGSPNAKVLIVEYSDTECPYCKVFQGTIHQLLTQYGQTGQVAWVYRHFPIADLHPKAPKEAEATECATEQATDQNKNTLFFNYIDQVYSRTNSNNSLDPAELPKIAADLKLDVTAFNTCLASGKYKAVVDANYADAIKNGASGTPFTVLVTKDVQVPITEGALPYDQMKSLIDQLLAQG